MPQISADDFQHATADDAWRVLDGAAHAWFETASHASGAALVERVREFWTSTLGYRPDPREGLTDIYDPSRLNPVFIFQRMDSSDEARRRQRNRIRVILEVPHDSFEDRIATATAAGGRVVDAIARHARVSDAEGNELDLIGEP